ncbi:hypothetical protein [Fastidiosibacter lacustris]|uniref:hypothetical protein n=1 Tax=Fastidiosibacter lacustris TaxID=2056695 RepID=UPI000E34CB49|nr:hypothetical protein [Fastidiosibacter lacustris]
MKKTITFTSLMLAASFTLACSAKNQLNIVFTSATSENVSHKAYVALGKVLFSTPEIANELHAYNTSINHKTGEIRLDISKEEQKEKLLKEIKQLLKQHDLKPVRVSYENIQA